MSAGIELPGPEDVHRETETVTRLARNSVRDFLKTIDMVSEAFLCYVLIALWDSGMYEYVRQNPHFKASDATDQLNLDPEVFGYLIEYLVGRGLMAEDADGLHLTEKGQPYWNYTVRGILIAHLAGYTALLNGLGPVLRKEIPIDDPSFERDGRQVAEGAGFSLAANGSIAWVIKTIESRGGRFVMDLGCGAGGFLVQLANGWPNGGGIGVDMSADAIRVAKEYASEWGVSDRVSFYCAKLSMEPLDIPKSILDRVDTITAMYVLHEFGGQGGPDRIAEIIGLLRLHFPGRTLIMTEGSPVDAHEMGKTTPATYSQLDYAFLHPISGQGPLRRPDEWESIISAAGATLVERIPGFNMVPAWISQYVVAL